MPRVDLADLALLGGRVLLLDDRLDVAVGVAHDPAVAERVGDHAARGCSPRAARPRARRRSARSVSPLQQRGVAVGDDDGAGGQRPAAPRPRPGRRARCRRCVVLDGEHARRAAAPGCARPTCSRWWPTTATTRLGSHRLHRGQHVADHAAPADRVQHLHGLRLHPGAAAGGQDDDGQVVRWSSRGSAGAPFEASVDMRAPRVGVEPTSLVLIQSQAGPAGRPTGDRPPRVSLLATGGPWRPDVPVVVARRMASGGPTCGSWRTEVLGQTSLPAAGNISDHHEQHVA